MENILCIFICLFNWKVDTSETNKEWKWYFISVSLWYWPAKVSPLPTLIWCLSSQSLTRSVLGRCCKTGCPFLTFLRLRTLFVKQLSIAQPVFLLTYLQRIGPIPEIWNAFVLIKIWWYIVLFNKERIPNNTMCSWMKLQFYTSSLQGAGQDFVAVSA